MRFRGAPSIAPLALALMLAGCAHGAKQHGAIATQHGHVAMQHRVLRATPAGLVPSSDAELDAAMAAARVVYLGERHDDPHAHSFEARLFARAIALDPTGAALGLEMLPRTMQPALDDYLAGRTDEAAFLRAVDWPRTWGFPFDYYRPLFALCREHRLRAWALNAPQSLAHRLAKGGLAALTDEERRALPEMRPGPAAHRAQLEEALAHHPGHPSSPETIQRYYLAQLLWDETMAESIARILNGDNAPRRLVVIAGEGHVRRFAIPERAERRGAQPDVVVISLYEDQVPGEGVDFVWLLGAPP